MAEIKLLDHNEEITGLNLSQFQDKPNIAGTLKTWADYMQLVENDLYDIMVETYFHNARGKNIERYGKLFGLPDIKQTPDQEYKERVIYEIIRRSSDGTPDRLRQIMEALFRTRNARVFEHPNPLTLTGGVFIYSYSTPEIPVPLSGNEGLLTKVGSPLTTGSCVFGIHEESNTNDSSLFIPCELVQPLAKMAVYPDGEDLLVTEADNNIALQQSRIFTYGAGWEQGVLSDWGEFGENVAVSNEQRDTDLLNVEANQGVEVLQASSVGFDNRRGIMLETAQYDNFKE